MLFNVKAIYEILLRRKWIILITSLVTIAVTITGTLLSAPIYTAKATVRVATSASNLMNYSDYYSADRIINTYIRIAMSGPIQTDLKNRMGVTTLPDIQVQTIPSTELIQISVDAGEPILAANTANVLSEILLAQSGELYTGSGKRASEILAEQISPAEQELMTAKRAYEDLLALTPAPKEKIDVARQAYDQKQKIYDSMIQQYGETKISESVRSNIVSIVDPAVVPSKPSKPNKVLNILLGALGGLIGGLALALVIESVDSTFHSAEQIELSTGLPLLAEIPTAKFTSSSISQNYPIESEAFRKLGSTLFILNQNEPCQTMLMTSAQQAEGKSFVVAGLAVALSQFGKKVCVVDTDMRLPTQNLLFDLSCEPGLSALLSQEALLMDVIKESQYPDLYIIPSGSMPANPTSLLGSQQMVDLLKTLSNQFDFVLIDSPSLLAVADAIVLAPMVKAVAMVIGLDLARKENVISTKRQLKDVKAKLLGVIINRTENMTQYYYHHHNNGRTKTPIWKTIPFLKDRVN